MNHPTFKDLADEAVVLQLFIHQCDDEWAHSDLDKRILLLLEARHTASRLLRQIDALAIKERKEATNVR